METLKINKIFRADKDKSGKALMTSDGRPYQRLAFKTGEYGDAWISGFGNKFNANWKEGDEVDVNVEKITKDGKEYLNFSTPSVWDSIRELERRVSILEGQGVGIGEEGTVEEGEDIPF